jgi:hypothetical protein
MGKIMQTVFGGKRSKQESKNLAYENMQRDFGGLQTNATTGANALNSLLSGDSSGFEAFKNATGYDFMAERGSRGITSNMAAKGLLRSGVTGKALMNFGNQMNNQYVGSYMDRLGQQADTGFKAGNLISGAGTYNKGTSSEKPDITKFIGKLAAASDIRLKQDIKKIGDFGEVGLYRYKYISGQGPYVGVMAQEVEEHYPDALGPVIGGYMTVDYGKLREIVNGPA